MEFDLLKIDINQILCTLNIMFFFLNILKQTLELNIMYLFYFYYFFETPKIKFSLNKLCTLLQHSLLLIVGLTSDPHIHNGQRLKTTPTNMSIIRLI